MNQTMTLHVPSGLYVRLKERAEQAHRSVEEEMIDLLAATVPSTPELSAELQNAMTSLELLDAEHLERAARSRFTAELAAELEALHIKAQREGLTDFESTRLAELVGSYERAMLVRAQAIAILKRRGADI